MHDPSSLAFDIYLFGKQDRKGHYNTPFISIWHCDPETDGSDDSCGWFIRSRHIDPKLYEKVKKEFAFNFKHEYWFNNGGYPKFTVPGIALNMYNTAAWQLFMYLNNGKPDRRRHDRFMRKHLYEILYFAENPTDSMHDSIMMKYGVEYTSARIDHFTSIVLADIMRKLRPWYKHPRWHVHHWEINFPMFRQFYRRWFERCNRCKGKIGTQSVYTDWNGTEPWCNTCNDKAHSKPKVDKA